MSSRVFVSLCVDDLDARGDPTRSDRVATYNCTPEEVATIMKVIKARKGECVDFPLIVTRVRDSERGEEDAAY